MFRFFNLHITARTTDEKIKLVGTKNSLVFICSLGDKLEGVNLKAIPNKRYHFVSKVFRPATVLVLGLCVADILDIITTIQLTFFTVFYSMLFLANERISAERKVVNALMNMSDNDIYARGAKPVIYRRRYVNGEEDGNYVRVRFGKCSLFLVPNADDTYSVREGTIRALSRDWDINGRFEVNLLLKQLEYMGTPVSIKGI